MLLQKILDRTDSLFRGKEDLNLTDGPVLENLFYLALPIVIFNLLRTAYNIADTFWLGQFSKEALAAITFAFPLVFLLISLGMGLSVAGNVLVSQLEGSGQKKRRNYAASQTIMFSFFASIVLGVIGYLFMPTIVTLFGAEKTVAAGATGYMQIISIGIFSMFGFAVFMSLMRGFGDVVTPMLIMLGTVIVNIIIDPFLINGWLFFPRMGVEGAAVATVFSRTLALTSGLYILFSGRRGIEISLSGMKPDLGFLKKVFRIGAPATLGGIGRSLSINLIVAVVGNLFASTVVSGYGIGVRIFSLIFLPAAAGGWAVSTMTGQNLGAGKPERAEQAANYAAKYMFLILAGTGTITFVFAEPIASVFTTNNEVAAIGTAFLRWVSLTFGFMGILRSYTGSLRGAGNTLSAAAISVATLAAIRLPIAYFGSLEIGTTGIWIAFAASNVGGATLAWLYYRRGTWKESVIDREKGRAAEEAEEFESTITDRTGENPGDSLKNKIIGRIPSLR